MILLSTFTCTTAEVPGYNTWYQKTYSSTTVLIGVYHNSLIERVPVLECIVCSVYYTLYLQFTVQEYVTPNHQLNCVLWWVLVPGTWYKYFSQGLEYLMKRTTWPSVASNKTRVVIHTCSFMYSEFARAKIQSRG